MDDKNRHSDEFEVSGQFAQDLKKLYGPKGRVPARVDMAVLDAAGRKLIRRRAAWWKWAGASAAAAVVLMGVIVLLTQGPGEQQHMGGQVALYPMAPATSAVAVSVEDIDGNGRVDMLDALKVARSIESGKADMKLDFNGDGVVDKRDIDTVAMAAVRLAKGA